MSFYISDKTVSIELWERKIEYDKIAFALFQLSETFEMRIANDSKIITDNRVNGKPIDNVKRVGTEVTVKPLPWIIDNFAYAQSVLDSTSKCVNSLFNEYGINLNPNWTEINKHWSKRIERLNTAYTNAVSEAVNAQIHNQQVRFQQAYNEELSRDSGLGFGIISNSLVSHLLYAAQSASKEVKDHERALKYANENSGENFADSMLALINVIYPFYMDNIEQNLIKILGEYYAYIVSLFSKELGYIYDDIEKQFNIDDSFSILDNGEISKDTLLSALEKNPNNGVVIGYAIQYGYLDRELCEYGHNSTPMFLRRLKNWAIARLSEIYKAGKLFNKPLINDENRIIINGLMDFYKVKYPKLEKCQDWQDILMGAFAQDVAKHLTDMGEIAVAKSNILIPTEFDKLARSGKKFYLNSESKSLFVCLYHELYFNGAYTSASFLDLKAPFMVEDIDRQIRELNEKLDMRSAEIVRQAEESRKAEEARKEALRKAEIERNEKIKKTAKKLTAIIAPIIAVFLAFIILQTTLIIPESKYKQAINASENKNYSKAIDLFAELGNYKNSKEQVERLLTDKPVYKFYKINIGDIVTLGQYEQDNNLQNGNEKIKWKVLSIEEDRVLLLSEYCIEYLQYHTEDGSITWENSVLRKWLNNSFYKQAFNSAENSIVLEVLNETPDYNDLRFIEGGNDTYDKVFCLSAKEVTQYTQKQDRKAIATAYAKSKGIYVRDNDGHSSWCLRSPGAFENYVAYVNWAGVINYAPSFVYHYQGVRPAIWVDIGDLD